MNNINPKHLLIGTVIIMLLILGLAYRFAYQPSVEEAEQIEESNKSLVLRKEELNNKIANKSMYVEGIENSKKLVDSVFKKYGPGNTPEKTIMMIVDLCEKTGISVTTASFNKEEPIYVSAALDENEHALYTLNKSQTNLAISGGYTDIKKFFDYVNCYNERMNVENFNLAYNLETGIINASATLNLYSVNDANHVYVAPEIEGIDIGTANVFRNFFAVEYDEFGNPILPEEGENAEGTPDAGLAE